MPMPTPGRTSAEDSIAALRQQIEERRRLSASDPDGQLLDLVRLSNTLGMELAAGRRFDEAYAWLQEALELCVRPPANTPAWTRALAVGLLNRGLVQAWLGRYSDALDSAHRAVTVIRELEQVTDDPIDHEQLLADALDSLSSRYAALGRHAEAIQPATESVRRYRELARSDPDRFEPALARALNNLGIRHCDLDRHSEALEATREALRTYRRLHAADPEPHLAGLAHTLSNLALRFARLERHAEVPAPVMEVVDLLHDLEDRHPANRLGELIGSLQWLATYLWEHHHRREARATTGAVRMLRQQVTAGP